ncbi:hypothetical protein HN670_03980 [bacterium]|nr:hypothetical protein [bacterium]MBT7553602.1 hypothetical protein [bacterium]
MRQRKFMSLGLVFVIVGTLWLLQEAGFISGGFWGYLIPVLVILMGLDMMQRNSSKLDCWFGMCHPHGKSQKHKSDHKVVDEQ